MAHVPVLAHSHARNMLIIKRGDDAIPSEVLRSRLHLRREQGKYLSY
ncbi:hypothetical protein [Citrobacter braakii]